jgi:hypothetical protein
LLEKRALRSPFYPPPNQGQEHVDFARKTTLKIKFKINQNLYTSNLSFSLAIFDKVQGQNRVDFARKMTQIQTQKPSFFCKKSYPKKPYKKSRKFALANRLF